MRKGVKKKDDKEKERAKKGTITAEPQPLPEN